jgi:hypothetical protein
MNVPYKPKLQLESLHDRHTGLTASLAGTFYEAASVCLSRHYDSPVNMEVKCNGNCNTRSVDFQKPDARTVNAYANDIDTTEFGAYGISLAAVEAEEQLVAVRRAETLTGADWYVAPVGTEPDDLENCFRLEVSGTDSGSGSILKSLLKQKTNQTQRGKSNLPAIASVVGFKERIIMIQRVTAEK